MGRFSGVRYVSFERKAQRVVLAFCWIIGICSGIFTYSVARDSLSVVIDGMIDTSVSMGAFFAALILPFILSAVAVWFSAPWAVMLICFGKAFLVSFVSAGLLLTLGASGRLIRFLLLLGDLAALAPLYWLWLCWLGGNVKSSLGAVLLVFSLVFLIGSIHFVFVLPVLAKLI